MGRRRKIFTKREYEKFKKTHTGRQKINITYATVALMVFVLSLIGVIYSYNSELAKSLRIYAYIALFVSALIALIFFILYHFENVNEKERLQKAEQEERLKNERQLARIKYEQQLAQKKLEEERDRLLKFKNSNMDEIDKMNGYQFESFVSAILEDLGYKTNTTKKSGDFGVDIIMEKDNEKIIIQTKRYAKKVSLNAVQEITSAKNYYNIQTAWVITNNYFTDAAKQLAEANSIKLIDRNELTNIIIKAQNIRATQTQSA